jgi:hypothetical protein
MSKATFVVVLTIPGKTSAEQLGASLNELVEEAKGGRVSGILVDVTALSKNEKRFNEIGEATGSRARMQIDPELYKLGVKKIAFVSPTGKYPGRDKTAPSVSKGPIKKKGSPHKHYFKSPTTAMKWLRS